jgi:hypothetical protein
LFAAFLGDGKDLDENIVDILSSSEALSIYFSLLFAIHRQLAAKREYMLKLASQNREPVLTTDEGNNNNTSGTVTQLVRAGSSCKKFTC